MKNLRHRRAPINGDTLPLFAWAAASEWRVHQPNTPAGRWLHLRYCVTTRYAHLIAMAAGLGPLDGRP